MTVVFLEDGKLALQLAYKDKRLAQDIGAKWDKRKKCWKLSDNVDLDHLKCLFTPEAAEYYQQQKRKRSALINLDVPVRYGDGLSDYQQKAVGFLATARRAILADDPGLGKTPTAIRAVMEVGAQHPLVVTKKTLIHNWEVEIKKWARDYGAWTVTNYEQLEKVLKPFDVLIVDEAQAIKNRKTKRAKLIHKLSRKCEYVWLLTGTPIVNGPEDLWSLLHTVDPEYFSSFWRFIEKHCETYHNYFGHLEIGSIKDDKAFARELAPYVLRRTKELLHLPPISFETIYVDLHLDQACIYRQLRHELIAWLDEHEEEYITATNTLALLTRLRQVTCSPALFGGRDVSTKTDTLLELLETYTPNHKVLVFTTFAEYINLLEPKLKPFRPVVITGSISYKQRDEAVDTFNNNPDCRVMLGTTGAMGEGLNLQAADVVIFLNHDWTPAANEQAYSRAYRRGQEKPVHVINLVASGTVDEHVIELLETKKQKISKMELIKKLREDLKRR